MRHCSLLLVLLISCGGTATVDGSSSSSSGGGTVTDCDGLASSYVETLKAARACDPTIRSVQCTAAVDDQLPCPCRHTFINPANAAADDLAAIVEEWTSRGCPSGDSECPAIGCTEATASSCEPDGAAGLCQDS